jgi:hypothetical protein
MRHVNSKQPLDDDLLPTEPRKVLLAIVLTIAFFGVYIWWRSERSSFRPTTIRVFADVDSSWLQNEERTCVTLPGANGRVETVKCEVNHDFHNIPIKFWGSVDRNQVSSWNCRREGDDFVCRARD